MEWKIVRVNVVQGLLLPPLLKVGGRWRGGGDGSGRDRSRPPEAWLRPVVWRWCSYRLVRSRGHRPGPGHGADHVVGRGEDEEEEGEAAEEEEEEEEEEEDRRPRKIQRSQARELVGSRYRRLHRLRPTVMGSSSPSTDDDPVADGMDDVVTCMASLVVACTYPSPCRVVAHLGSWSMPVIGNRGLRERRSRTVERLGTSTRTVLVRTH